jgi:hypothetical protein
MATTMMATTMMATMMATMTMARLGELVCLSAAVLRSDHDPLNGSTPPA